MKRQVAFEDYIHSLSDAELRDLVSHAKQTVSQGSMDREASDRVYRVIEMELNARTEIMQETRQNIMKQNMGSKKKPVRRGQHKQGKKS